MSRISFLLEIHRNNFYLSSKLPLNLRLQKNAEWRELIGGELLLFRESDFSTQRPLQIMQFCSSNKSVFWQGSELRIWSKALPVMDEQSYNYQARIQYESSPPCMESLVKMAKTLKKGDDNKFSRLIIDSFGKFSILTKDSNDLTCFSPLIACYARLAPHQGYMGAAVEQKYKFFKDLYKQFEIAWKEHVGSGLTNISCYVK